MFSNKSKRPTPDSLQEESQSVLSVFRQAIGNLSDICSRADAEKEVKLEEARQAESDAKALELLSSDSNKVIENINNLLNN